MAFSWLWREFVTLLAGVAFAHLSGIENIVAATVSIVPAVEVQAELAIFWRVWDCSFFLSWHCYLSLPKSHAIGD